MGFIDKISKRGKIKEGCSIDKEQGVFRCSSKRVFEDGTEEDLGEITGSINANCEITPDSMQEYEDGTLDRLHKKFVSKIKSKCPTRPSDF